MKIVTEEGYRKALERVNSLRSSGFKSQENAELAEVESAIAAYENLADQPDISKDARRVILNKCFRSVVCFLVNRVHEFVCLGTWRLEIVRRTREYEHISEL